VKRHAWQWWSSLPLCIFNYKLCTHSMKNVLYYKNIMCSTEFERAADIRESNEPFTTGLTFKLFSNQSSCAAFKVLEELSSRISNSTFLKMCSSKLSPSPYLYNLCITVRLTSYWLVVERSVHILNVQNSPNFARKMRACDNIVLQKWECLWLIVTRLWLN